MNQFRQLLQDAEQSEPSDANAMVLATASASAAPTARTVLLKRITDNGLVFFTNEGSVKGQQLAANPQASAVFYWRSISQQVLFDGDVEIINDEDSDAYWRTRSRESQLAAWASAQSQPLDSRDALEQRLTEARTRHQDVPVPRPSYWFGYCLQPKRIEFWRAGWHRLHARIQYQQAAGGWHKQLLNP